GMTARAVRAAPCRPGRGRRRASRSPHTAYRPAGRPRRRRGRWRWSHRHCAAVTRLRPIGRRALWTTLWSTTVSAGCGAGSPRIPRDRDVRIADVDPPLARVELPQPAVVVGDVDRIADPSRSCDGVRPVVGYRRLSGGHAAGDARPVDPDDVGQQTVRAPVGEHSDMGRVAPRDRTDVGQRASQRYSPETDQLARAVALVVPPD